MGTVDPYRKSRLPYKPAAAKAAPPVPWVNTEANKGPRRGRYCKTGPQPREPNHLPAEGPTRGHAEVDAAGQIGPAASCPTRSKAGKRLIGLDEVTKAASGSTKQKAPLVREALSGVRDKRAFPGSNAAAKADSGPGSGSAHRGRKPRKAAKAPDMSALQDVSLASGKQSRTLTGKPCATPPIRSGRAAKAAAYTS